jgi:type II secretory pathway pseudopilin PulG
MKKRELKEKTKFQKWGIFRLFHSAIPACAGASAGRRNQHSAIQNWVTFRLFQSAIPACAGASVGRRNPQSAIGNKGFTLIEIIVLIVMAGILLPVIIVPFVTGVKSSGKPEMATKAMYLAHQRMEEFTKFQYTDATLNPIGLTAYAAIPGNSGYEWQWEILYINSNNLNGAGWLNHPVNYKRVLVRIKDPQNDAYEIYSVVTRFP